METFWLFLSNAIVAVDSQGCFPLAVWLIMMIEAPVLNLTDITMQEFYRMRRIPSNDGSALLSSAPPTDAVVHFVPNIAIGVP